jgi:glycosyltransferase involved in cell wall biosynthesis
MRILTVSHFYEAHGGGIERVAGHLCRQFAQLGLQAAWAASAADPAPGAPVEAAPLVCWNPLEKLTGLPMPLPGAAAIRALARAVRDSDAVVIHDALYVTSILAMMLAKRCRKPAVLIQHIAAIPFSSRLLRLLMAAANALVTQPMLRSADARVFISDAVRRELIGSPSRLPHALLFNGVDTEVFHLVDGPLSRPAGDRSILFVGRYVEKKGLSVLRALARSRPDWRFLTVGSGPIKPAEWGLANVTDLGAKDRRALADLYRRADVLLLPSVGEGYPLVIQEAMACGLPVVCGEASARADPDAGRWLRGVAIDLADVEGSAHRCAAAIDALSPDPEARVAMARYAAARYDWTAMARGVVALVRGETATAIGPLAEIAA